MAPAPATAPERPLTVESAREQVSRATFTACDTTRVGLELEFHLIDLDDVAHRPGWERVAALLVPAPVLPGGSRLTVEPGGQLELSAPPAPDVATAVAMLHSDVRALRRHCRQDRLGLLPWGADPVREPCRVNPGPRYAAMAAHFAARGCAEAGRRMMTSTASLQVNLDVGDGEVGVRRWRALSAMAPVLTALSACSPQLDGHRSGWASMRQQTWEGLESSRSGAVPAEGDPGEQWASYALAAPVMLVPDHGGGAEPVRRGTSFADWLARPDLLGRAATPADLTYHLTTLFPPVRPRGFLEVRCLDAVDGRYWPALVAVTALVQHEQALSELPGLCAGLPDVATAARAGVRHEALRTASAAVLALAARHHGEGAEVGDSIGRLADLTARGLTPGDEVRARIDAVGAEAAVLEAAHPAPSGQPRAEPSTDEEQETPDA
ncbi:ergothioneine biosynthesis glutamate--cysteine ligase EgtA [Nocardioidaceae bacterium]|nr:ergothioneine biosynthesis glutamate--cysteine ligase EgtA [Nocardioidaceae bacterium]